jgi:hypothetical protein
MAKAYKPLPAADELWELFSLDPFTGALYWRTHRSSARIGKPFGCRFNSGYIVGEIRNNKYAAHRLVWKWLTGTEPQEVDHIDRNRTNNSPWNLRSTTRSGNHCNRSNVKGYTKTSSGTYRALIGINGVQYYLGHYETAQGAREAYLTAAALLHGNHTPEKGLPGALLGTIKRFRAKTKNKISRA